MYIKSYKKCCHCDKDIISSRHGHHERSCQNQLYKISLPKKSVGRPKGGYAWNRGLTKETSALVNQISNNVSIAMKNRVANGLHNITPMSEEARKALSERQSLHNTGGKCKWYTVAGKSVQGTYEKQFAEFLESHNVKWEKVSTNNHIFTYISEGKEKSYAPDFYLIEYDLYVEIKGYWWGADREKMEIVKSQHKDKKVIILFGKEKLNCICQNDIGNLLSEPVWSWR